MTDLGHPPLVVHVVTHTHWDREWYRSAEEFRLGLVDLVDEVLDGFAGPHFLLDGQSIALLDYLAMRPEREGGVRAALREGRIEAGPWFVLGDNLLVGGEALIRNLLVGRAVLQQLDGRAPSVLYC
ncbi:MAG: alpha-mannosidase, partial [Gemmatimonadota bacterium]